MDGKQKLAPSDARGLALALLREHALDDWTFAFDRAKRTMGMCRHSQRRIELSIYFVLANVQHEVRDCILHEIAHAIAGLAAGHGPKWQAVCRRIGARPERCGDAEMPGGTWWAECPNCRQKFTRHRRPRRNLRYSCGDCGSEAGRLRFSRTTHRQLTRE